jgi:hypothetical protein
MSARKIGLWVKNKICSLPILIVPIKNERSPQHFSPPRWSASPHCSRRGTSPKKTLKFLDGVAGLPGGWNYCKDICQEGNIQAKYLWSVSISHPIFHNHFVWNLSHTTLRLSHREYRGRTGRWSKLIVMTSYLLEVDRIILIQSMGRVDTPYICNRTCMTFSDGWGTLWGGGSQ